MARSILVIDGHPDPDSSRLGHALADAYAEGARSAGHAVTLVRLCDLDVPFLRSDRAFRSEAPPASLAAAAAAIPAADHVVLVFPLWLGSAPALVKAFLEQAFRPGIAFRYEADGRTTSLLRGKSARIVVTMGMPAFLYRLWYGGHGIRWLERSVLGFVGMRPIRRTLLGLVDGAKPERRARWLETVRQLGGKGT